MAIGRRTRWWLAGAAAAAAVAVAAVLVVQAFPDSRLAAAARPSPAPPTSTPKPKPKPKPKPARGAAVIAVKIDNVSDARPQTGIGAADVLYVEPVEAGLTRMMAIYAGHAPDVVGPTRSARRTDIQLLAQYGKPVLAYSGAAPELLPSLHHASIVNGSPAQAPPAFYRNNNRPAPHNLYVRPARLPHGAKGPTYSPLQFGAAPGGGAPETRLRVDFRSATITVRWMPRYHRWLVALDGRPLVDTRSGPLRVANVVRQSVAVSTSESIEDANGVRSPVVKTVGRGRAVVLRNGKRFAATWTRPTAQAPTRFLNANHRPLPLAPGPVLILLVPA